VEAAKICPPGHSNLQKKDLSRARQERNLGGSDQTANEDERGPREGAKPLERRSQGKTHKRTPEIVKQNGKKKTNNKAGWTF